MLVKEKVTHFVYRVEEYPDHASPIFQKYWRAYRQRKLSDGTYRDASLIKNPVLLRKIACVDLNQRGE